MSKSKAILKIEKMLNKFKGSNFDESHVEIFFITARELPRATKNIFEIGSFVAHGVKRDQGVINDIMLRNHLLLSFSVGKDKELIDYEKNKYPKYLPDLIKLQLKLFSDEDLKQALNLKGGQVQKARAALTKKNMFVFDGEFCSPTDKMGANESSIVTHILSLLSTEDGIRYETLIEELEILLQNDIDIELINCLGENKKEIFCYLLLLLNNVLFSIRGKVIAKTIISIDENDTVNICGSYPIINRHNKSVDIMSSVFFSDYLSSDIFEEDVTVEDLSANNLEFSQLTKKLTKMKNIV